MMRQDEHDRRYDAAKQAAKAKADEDAQKRQAVTEKLRAMRMAREANQAGSTEPKPPNRK